MIQLTPNVRRLIHGVYLHFQAGLAHCLSRLFFRTEVSVEARAVLHPDLSAPFLMTGTPRNPSVFRCTPLLRRDVLGVHLDRTDTQVDSPVIEPVSVDVVHNISIIASQPTQSAMQQDGRGIFPATLGPRHVSPAVQSPTPLLHKRDIGKVDECVRTYGPGTIQQWQASRLMVNRFGPTGLLERSSEAEQGAVKAGAGVYLRLLDRERCSATEARAVYVRRGASSARRGTLRGHHNLQCCGVTPRPSSPRCGVSCCENYTRSLRVGAA